MKPEGLMPPWAGPNDGPRPTLGAMALMFRQRGVGRSEAASD